MGTLGTSDPSRGEVGRGDTHAEKAAENQGGATGKPCSVKEARVRNQEEGELTDEVDG